MKTIAFNQRPSNFFTFALVVGGLIGLYYYRRQGGRVGDLLSAGSSYAGRARDFIREKAPAVDQYAGTRAQEIPTSNESLDGFPST